MVSVAEYTRHSEQNQQAHSNNNQQGVINQAAQHIPATPEETVMQLQATIGNQALTDMIDAGMFSKENQPKASGAGKKMPKAVQQKMEASFQTDFSDVEIHEDAKVASMGARAYAQSNQLFFAPGQFSPNTETGQSLIGHELAHVVQQREGRVDTPQGKGMPIVLNPALETEADQAGDKAAKGLPAQSTMTHSAGGYGAQLSHEQNGPIQASFFSKALGGIKKAGSAFVENGGLQILGGALAGAASGYAASRGEEQQEGGGGMMGMIMSGVGMLGGLLGGLGGKKDKGNDEAEAEAEEALEEVEEQLPEEDKEELAAKMGIPTPEEDEEMYAGLADLFKEEEEDDGDLGLRWLFGEEDTVSEQPSSSKTSSSASSSSDTQKATGATRTTSAKTKKTKAKN